MIRRGGFFISLLCLLGLACGETSRDEAPGGGSGGLGPAMGGAFANGSGGVGANRGGTGGAGSGVTGGAGPNQGGMAGRESGGSGTGGDTTLGAVDLDGTPIYTRVQRLTNQQWENAVNDILRFSERQALAARFVPADSGVTASTTTRRSCS